ncbi:ferric reductase like transmembrane component-domain-containing protein [Zychaea mexicana]|uniref:ferric reductase like transmembrane component-domain-containing protein n=1 Tax=Zychaea mexicana TaxID=64656 RepID=UPI0022FE2187|nr:ferric reductase like transmembrane component-domain-containing protein [Zychaea mexicana]KAI9497036.1 ferric reductase like transmembrane component-domain-containing protein [Zychaea mexicana]
MKFIIPHDRFVRKSDFNKAAYSYALFSWTLFFGYCVAYQISRIYLYRTRKQRIQNDRRGMNADDDDDDNDIKDDKPDNNLPLNGLFNTYVRIPWLTNMIPVKHVLGVSLFFITNVIFCFFAPFVLAPYVPEYEVPIPALMDRRCVYIGMVNWSFVIVLGLRNNIVTRMSGLTFEALVPFHRWVARIGLLEFIPHIVYRLWWAYDQHKIWYEAMTLDSEYMTGTLATFGFFLIFITAFEYIRRNHFELFYYTHIIGFVIAMIGALTHEISCIYYFSPAIILWIADRLLRSYRSWRIPSTLQSIEPVSNNIMRIRFKYDGLGSFVPGQYVFMAFAHSATDKLGKKYRSWWQHYLNWYPMTVAEISKTIQWDETTLLPRMRGTSDTSSATVYIKALGDFTKSLYNAASLGQVQSFKVDGPYGPRLEYQDSHVMACFALGVGVTPALALIQDCMNRRSAGSSTVLTSSIHLYWIIRHAGS